MDIERLTQILEALPESAESVWEASVLSIEQPYNEIMIKIATPGTQKVSHPGIIWEGFVYHSDCRRKSLRAVCSCGSTKSSDNTSFLTGSSMNDPLIIKKRKWPYKNE